MMLQQIQLVNQNTPRGQIQITYPMESPLAQYQNIGSPKPTSLFGSKMNKYSKGNFTNPLDNKKYLSRTPSRSEAVYLNPITNYRNLSTIIKQNDSFPIIRKKNVSLMSPSENIYLPSKLKLKNRRQSRLKPLFETQQTQNPHTTKNMKPQISLIKLRDDR